MEGERKGEKEEERETEKDFYFCLLKTACYKTCHFATSKWRKQKLKERFSDSG